MSDYCITTLSCGDKYNKYLRDNLLSMQELKGIKIFVTTDDPKFFKDCDVEVFYFKPEKKLPDTRKNRKNLWFNYHQKRLAIQNAFGQGYNKIFYIDSDIKLHRWDEDFLIKKDNGFWFRTMLPRTQHVEKYKFYDKLYEVEKWHYYRPLSEKIIYINECSDKIRGFLGMWESLEKKSKGKVNPYSEGHEILISLRFNGANVQRYKPDPFKGELKFMEDAHL